MSLWTARAHQLREAQAQQLANIVRTIDPTQLEQTSAYAAYSTTEGEQLRGIPAIGRGVTGAIPGTSPHSIR